MGLFTNLLLLPVTGPYRGLRFLLEQIQEQTNAEFFDPSRIQVDLVVLGMRLDQGEITEDEYLDAEAVLLERLNQARTRWDEQVGGTTVEADKADNDGADMEVETGVIGDAEVGMTS